MSSQITHLQGLSLYVYTNIVPAKNVIKEYHENSYYHLYNRGVAKQPIFLDTQDYKMFLFYLKLYLTPPNLQGETLKTPPTRKLKNFYNRLKLLAYCLMPNHFHLLLYQKEAEGINLFMRSLATIYAIYFNHRYKRVGTIFQGAYKAVLVETETQLVYLSKYIHRNPREILPTRRDLVGYKYSSYGNYLRLFQQDWVKPNDILNLFSTSKPVGSYQTFVEETDERDLPTIKNIVIEEV